MIEHLKIKKDLPGPSLKSCCYLDYPDYDESIEREIDIQLHLCIRDLYNYVHNSRVVHIKSKISSQIFLRCIGDLTSIVSVALETQSDENLDVSIQKQAISRLQDQLTALCSIRRTAEENTDLMKLISRTENAISAKLYCFGRLIEEGDEKISINDNFNNQYCLTPLRIKYPYVTGTYTPILQFPSSSIQSSKPNKPISTLRMLNQSNYRVNDTIPNLGSEKFSGISLAMLLARARYTHETLSQLKNSYNKEKSSKEIFYRFNNNEDKETNLRSNNEIDNSISIKHQYNHIHNTKHNKNKNKKEDSCVNQNIYGGAARLIVNKSWKTSKNAKGFVVDGWGIIEPNVEQVIQLEDSIYDVNLIKNEISQLTPKSNKIKSNLIQSVHNKMCKPNDGNQKINTPNIKVGDNVAILRGIFEKDVLYTNTKSNNNLNKERLNLLENKNTETGSRPVSSISYMPSQFCRQRQVHRDAALCTSGWNTGRGVAINFDTTDSNAEKLKEKSSGAEYDPVAEYARFSNTVGKVIHPIVADESYRNDSRRLRNPQKLFNAKSGTLSEDVFREIQEKLRLKMEGWTVQGSGLQDPRAYLFWDPAVMTAASTSGTNLNGSVISHSNTSGKKSLPTSPKNIGTAIPDKQVEDIIFSVGTDHPSIKVASMRSLNRRRNIQC
ncbi:uncharacterized protein CMU_041850 [Cryptosporidium muris RN66]|uniref:Uncharacterized protein n=1 Tax=Cryptosporidium muris (strain RN66) TaxID=441375 RepID=B6AA71_CRYMR|nr:uncharacterized protein CMU_041850 [Cryptosporidium muris RN66]EEA05112.1 hypothetical protein, conserved [Cryptosporidium muris RN66]|eukprot:XP_002139461.1 hypothetical protein [Cryptosporidium muris RN66]